MIPSARPAPPALSSWRGIVAAGMLAAWAGGAAAEEAAAPAVIESHGISTFGDLKYPADFKHFDYVNPDAPKGGAMSFRGTGASQTFDSLNAFILKGEPAQGLGLLYDSLLVGSADEIDSAYGLVAESLEYPPDRSWVTFHMRPEARFADGAPITAEDVVWTFETLRDKGAPTYRIMLADVAGAEALDPHTVRFTFKEGVPTRDLPGLVGGLSILPKHYYATVPFENSTLTPPVGSGQYQVAAVQPGRSIRYCRIPDYWGKDLPVNVGSSNFDCYVYEYFGDNTAAFEALKSGQYLFHEEFFSAIWAKDYNFPALNKGWVKREELPDNRPSGTQGFWMNMRKPQLQDIRVREAIGLMFNFEWSNATLFYGNYERTVSFFQNSPMMAEGLPGGTSFMEDYTYDLTPGRERILGAHMLEVCPSIAAGTPTLEVHPLSIGGRDDPVRLRFTAAPGNAVVVGICDMGSRFRLVANEVRVVEPTADLPNLPVAYAVWEPLPSWSTSAEAWLMAGAPHHTVLTTALGTETIDDFAAMTETELLVIDADTTTRGFAHELRWNDVYHHVAAGL